MGIKQRMFDESLYSRNPVQSCSVIKSHQVFDTTTRSYDTVTFRLLLFILMVGRRALDSLERDVPARA